MKHKLEKASASSTVRSVTHPKKTKVTLILSLSLNHGANSDDRQVNLSNSIIQFFSLFFLFLNNLSFSLLLSPRKTDIAVNFTGNSFTHFIKQIMLYSNLWLQLIFFLSFFLNLGFFFSTWIIFFFYTDGMFKGIYNGKQHHVSDIATVLSRAWNAGVDRIIVS